MRSSREIALQIVDAGDLRLVGQRRSGVHRLRLQPSAGVELLERHAPRVDLRVTLRAAGLVAMLLQPLAEREALASSSFSAGTFGGGSSGGSAMILRASHAPRFTGFDSRPSDSPARIAACVSTPPRSRRPCGIGDEPEAALGLVAEVVVAGDDFVGDHEIGLHQVPHRQVVPDQVLQELDRLLLAAACACRA